MFLSNHMQLFEGFGCKFLNGPEGGSAGSIHSELNVIAMSIL